jgi:transcriptional regulator with XRE-family HTH domain
MRARRRQLKMTVTELSFRAGRSPYSLNDYERGLNEPPASVALAIATALDVTVADLCEEAEPMMAAPEVTEEEAQSFRDEPGRRWR